ncbi:MAG: hypothetical protein KF718_33270 [Polyangiaceae bacterium]|nr:hypothetical protein [Polyangiaceae bacterium]
MTSRLETLLAEIQDDLDAAFAGLYPDGLSYKFARRGREEAGRPPRIVWVPVEFDDSAALASAGGNPRALCSHEQGIDSVCWGATFAATEELVFQLKRALIRRMGASRVSLALLGGTWAPDEWAHDGWVAIQRFSLKYPVLNELPDVAVTSIEHTSGFAGSVSDGCGPIAPEEPEEPEEPEP